MDSIQKICCLCKTPKELNEFNKKRRNIDGHSNICRVCSNKHSKEYYRKNDKKMKKQIHESKTIRIRENRMKVFHYLSQHSCVDCDENDPIVLEFDHVRGKKIHEVSKLVGEGYSWKRIENEIKKCDVRCANCHRRKTAKEQNWYTVKNLEI
jgi:hypothetical protein